MNAQNVQADVILDLKGLTCPGPLLGAKQMVDHLNEGQTLILVSDCPGTQDDLLAWAKQTGNHVLKTEPQTKGGTGYYIQKGKGPVRKVNVLLDIRGAACPGPIVEAKKLLNGMNKGEILKLVSNCPGIQSDMADWATATGAEIVDTFKIGANEYEFYIEKS